jgi:hypothetical protein
VNRVTGLCGCDRDVMLSEVQMEAGMRCVWNNSICSKLAVGAAESWRLRFCDGKVLCGDWPAFGVGSSLVGLVTLGR